MQTILLQRHHRSLVFTATSSCCLSSLQMHQCHSPSGRSHPAVMTPLTSTLSAQHCWPLQYHLSYTNTDQHNCQQLVVESAIERLHQGIKSGGPNISSQINHITGLSGYRFCILGTFKGDCRYFCKHYIILFPDFQQEVVSFYNTRLM